MSEYELIYSEDDEDPAGCKRVEIELYAFHGASSRLKPLYGLFWGQTDGDGESTEGFCPLRGLSRFEAIRKSVELASSMKKEVGL